MRNYVGSVLAGLVLGATVGFCEEKPVDAQATAEPKPRVQIAILLDTSGSMQGLIEQAKSQLWKIVNEFATASRGGQRPEMQVALYHYGTPALGAATGYTKQLLPLTTDLDKVSEELFKLRTSGGDEYCGTVIQAAVENLEWSKGKNDYMAIFIAGNEPFTQGKSDYKTSCQAAIAKGIVVNTIFCGDAAEGIRTQWKDGADRADGTYANIDHTAKVAQIAAPQDKELADLSAKMSGTYVTYGRAGAEGLARQRAADSAAATMAPAAAAERAQAKAGVHYWSGSWDLVDAVKAEKVKVGELKDEDLPEEMKKLTADERKAYVETKTKERAEIQARIQQLSKEREAHIAAERAKQAATGAKTLDDAVINAVRTQAQKREFTF